MRTESARQTREARRAVAAAGRVEMQARILKKNGWRKEVAWGWKKNEGKSSQRLDREKTISDK
jgi:hypothetical protein